MRVIEEEAVRCFLAEVTSYSTDESGWQRGTKSDHWKLRLSQVYPEEIGSNFLVLRIIKHQSINYNIVCEVRMGMFAKPR